MLFLRKFPADFSISYIIYITDGRVFAKGAQWGATQAAGLPVAAGLPHYRTKSPERAGHLAVHQLQLWPVSSIAAATHPTIQLASQPASQPFIPLIPSSPRHSLQSIRSSILQSICPSIQPHTYTHHHQKAPSSSQPPTITSPEQSHPTTHQTKDTGKRT